MGCYIPNVDESTRLHVYSDQDGASPCLALLHGVRRWELACSTWQGRCHGQQEGSCEKGGVCCSSWPEATRMQSRPWHLKKEVVTGRFAGNRCGRRRKVQGQGGWCGWFRCKKKVVGDRVAGTGPYLKVCSNGCGFFFSLLAHMAGWHSSKLRFQLGTLGCREDSILEHLSMFLQGLC